MTERNLEQTWHEVQQRLGTAFPGSVYRTWLASLRPLRIEGATLYVQAPDAVRDWVARRFGSSLHLAAIGSDPSLQRVELVSPSAAASRSAANPLDASTVPASLNVQRSFEDFVIGAGNRFAHAAALAVAEIPGGAYNPLLVCGPPGTGKTHLLQAIGNYVSGTTPAAIVHYTTGARFTDDFTSAIRQNHIDVFKRHYRNVQLLLVDDLDFLEGKTRTTEELLHTLDAALNAGAQVVLSAAAVPPSFEPRISERLRSGLLVKLELPDRPTRLAILKKLAATAELKIEPEVLDHVADRIHSGTAALAGALTRLSAYSSLTGQPLSQAVAEEVLSQLYAPAPRHHTSPTTTVRDIQHAVSKRLDISINELNSARRGRRLVYARQLAMYLCRELTTLSLPAIASQFGGRDHTTVLHAHRKVQGLLLTDPEAKSLVNELLLFLSTTPVKDGHNPLAAKIPS